MFNQDIGIDLGTTSIVAYIKDKGITLREPTVIAVSKKNGEVLAIGHEARRMIGRTPNDIISMRPIQNGVVADYKMAEKMLKAFLRRLNKSKLFPPRVMVSIPSGITEVEKKATIDVMSAAGARTVYLVEEPIAAAIRWRA